MLIKEGYTVHSWDNGKWVINSPEGRNFLINEVTFKLFNILETHHTLENAHEAFEKEFLIDISFNDFQQHISTTIGGFGILANDFEVARPSMKNKYLKLKIQIINAQIAGFLAKPLTVFYNPKVFWYILASLIVFIASMFLNSSQKIELTALQMPVVVGLFYLSMPIHELGHIAACKSYNLKHGGIGFGFYFVLPVMYADITNIWAANKQKRIIANMGGIFSEILYSSILLIAFLITKNPIFFVTGISLATMVVWEFNPFVRFDGYWILSDLTNTPNLIKKSKYTLKTVYKRLQERTKLFLTKNEVWLFLYGLINTGFFIAFMVFTIYSFRAYIVLFPQLIYGVLSKWLSGNFDVSNINRQFLFILTFYILFFRFCIQNLSKISRTWLKRVS
jgi:putative peptide zinc metalloprotease protein